jgi:uncharacterized membrane protein
MTTTAPLTEAAASAGPAPGASPSWRPLAGLLAVAGIGHFLTPRPFEAVVPRALGDPKPWVAASGVAELVCAAALAAPRTRRAAGLASAVLFVAVYPANVQMTVTAFRSDRTSAAYRAATVARLPMQVPLVVQALRIARGSTRRSGDAR